MFSPPVYISIGDEYDKRPAPSDSRFVGDKPFTVTVRKHPHITDSIIGGYKSTSAGDPYVSRSEAAGSSDNAGRRAVDQPPFRPGGVSHKSSSKGDYYGTFQEGNPPKHEPIFPAIDKSKSEQEAKMHTKRLMYTNPAKKGTYGFTGLTIQQKGEIQYVSEPYDGSRRKEMLDGKASGAKQMGRPFRAAVRSGGFFSETEHGYPQVYSLTKPLPPKNNKQSSVGKQPLNGKPWVPGGALSKVITQQPEYLEDPDDERERKIREMRKAERGYKAWQPVGNDPYRYIYTKPIQYNPPPVV